MRHFDKIITMNFLNSFLPTMKVWPSQVGIFILAVAASLIIIRILVKYALALSSFLKSMSPSIKKSVVANHDVKNFIAKRPTLFKFIGNRLNKDKFSGLPLTLLGMAFIYVLYLFFGIIHDIITTDVIVAADARIANLLFAFRDDELIKIFTWVTLFGKWQIVVSSAIILCLILWLWKKRMYLLPLWVTIIGSMLFNSLLKSTFHRPRPDVALYVENTFSFPSGHATMAVAFYGFLAYILCRQIKKWKYKINALFFGIILILAIGLSRLYLGLHFLSDVYGGYLLGALWLLIGITIAEWLQHRDYM